MTDLLEYIKKMQEMYGDDVITTADKINRPEPKKEVQEIEAINAFMKRNPKAGGGMLVKPSADGSRPGYKNKRVYDSPDVDAFSDALLDAYAKDDITKIVESGKSTKFANVITAIESGKDKSAKLAKVIKNTGLDEETIFNLLDDRKAYIDLAREGGPAGANPRAGNFYKKAENWITTNSKRYADPNKFKKAFIRTFGTNNDLIKTMKKLNVPGARKKTSVPFSGWFKESILGTQKGSEAGYNYNQLDNIFKTAIYTNNPNVRKNITKEINKILSIPLEKGGKFDIRNEIKNNSLFKKFGFDKQIRGPIARLLANEIGQELLDQVSSFRDPYLGTTELIRFLKNNVDPKYKSMFEEAAKAADLAAKNKWPEAKQILKIKDNIMFDHKIPKELVKLGYADELEYIKLNPTSAEFNTRIKNPQFDQKIIKLVKDFERTTSLDGKTKIVEKMNILKNNFSKKYGGYLDEVSIVPDKTGKPIFKSSAAPVTKKTDFVSSLGKSMVQEGTLKQGSPLYNKLMKFCPRAAKSNGGEAGVCTIDEAMKGMISESKQLQSGNMNDAQAKKTAQKIRAVTRVGTGSTLMGLLGPYGLAGEVVIDGAFMANNMLDGGDTYEEALAKTLIRYAMPTEQRKDLEKRTERDRMIIGSDTKGLAANYVSAKQKYDDLINKYENVQRIKKDETFDPNTLIPTYSPKDEIKAQKDFERSQIKAEPMYGKNIFDILKFGSPEQQAFAAKEEVFDAQKMQNKMDYDRKILGPIKDLFGTGFYSPAQLDLLQKKADRETLDPFGRVQMSDEDKMQEIANYGGVANLAGGGIAGLSGGIDQGPQRRSLNPDSQGLRSLIKNGRKL